MTKLVLISCVIMALLCPAGALAKEPSPAEVKQMQAAIETVCPLIEQEAGLMQQIALERQNPSGVVSLRRLHELGELLQFTRGQLVEARSEHAEGLRLFRDWAKKPLDLGFCTSWSKAHE